MAVTEIHAKTILNKQKKIDSWFLSRYGMNIYRGCLHNCVYCDGRAEKYRVEGNFGTDITVKTNAPELLHKALGPSRRRVPLKPSFIMLGGGVGDSYQPVEKKYLLTRRSLEVIETHGFPVHILTKSTLVERDVDILKRISSTSSALLSMSFATVDDTTSRAIEPRCAPPSERLRLLSEIKRQGLSTAMFLLPVLPGISDTQASIDHAVAKAKEACVDFVAFGGLTLKPGRQKDAYYKFIDAMDPELPSRYNKIYPGNKWGTAVTKYYERIDARFAEAAGRYRVARRAPSYLFKEILDENDRVVVTLENLGYFTKSQGERSPYGHAAYTISKLKTPLSAMGPTLHELQGVSTSIRKIIHEILKTGASKLHESYFF